MLTVILQTKRTLYTIAFATVLTIFAPFALGAELAPQQMPLQLKATDVLPKALRAGEGYSVKDKVLNDGFQNTYTLQTDYGEYTITGNAALAARVQEIKATKVLEEIERSDAFKDAVKGAATGMVEGGKSLVTSPVETSKGAVKGVGRWLGNVGRSVTSKDPHQDNALKTLIGHDAVKRGYAIEMGVDPYTDFEPFQKRMGEVARAATAGGLVVTVGADMGTSGAVGTIVTLTSVAAMKEMLKEEPPTVLARINREKLEKMGIDSIAIDALLKNYNYTPVELTAMVEALRRMGGIKGRHIFVAYATAAPDRTIVRFMQQYAEMLANYITSVETGDIVSIDSEAWLRTRSDKLVAAIPADYLAWSPELEGAERSVSAQAEKLGIKGKKFLVEGRVDPQARKALESRGWKVSERVQLVSGGKS
jgi:hypothetical protein